MICFTGAAVTNKTNGINGLEVKQRPTSSKLGVGKN